MSEILTPEQLVQALAQSLSGKREECHQCQHGEPHLHHGTRRALAQALGTSETQVDRLLKGVVNVHWSTVERMVKALEESRRKPLAVKLILEERGKK